MKTPSVKVIPGSKNQIKLSATEFILIINPGEQSTFNACVKQFVEALKAEGMEDECKQVQKELQRLTADDSLWDAAGKWIGSDSP